MGFLKKLLCSHDYKEIQRYFNIYKRTDSDLDSYYDIRVYKEYECPKCKKIKKIKIAFQSFKDYEYREKDLYLNLLLGHNYENEVSLKLK